MPGIRDQDLERLIEMTILAHLTDDELGRYHDDAVHEVELAQIEAHLQRCQICSRRYEGLKRSLAVCDEVEVPPEDIDRAKKFIAPILEPHMLIMVDEVGAEVRIPYDERQSLGDDEQVVIDRIMPRVEVVTASEPKDTKVALLEGFAAPQFYLNNEPYQLKPSRMDPFLFKLEGFPGITLLKKRKKDIEAPGTYMLTIRVGREDVAFSLSEFRDVQGESKYKFAAEENPPPTAESRTAESSVYPILEHEVKDKNLAVQVFSDDSGSLFLRFSQKR